ncbi:MAG TPA: HNH endonuclease [Actinocrinis sp.]|uniref:HNH endonuclease n=1 Tax=Actinocrinis sp. TaxID=1920516 RepID=UPI002DDCA9EB|nr:HNH endonuclease [Actinocrinis sp.]HEV2344345.1 HNH endonuclease [Actinocrinis sp.]
MDKNIPWKPATKVSESTLAQAAVTLEQGVDERVVAWVEEDAGRARAILASWRTTTMYEEYQRLSTGLFELQHQLRPYTGTASDARLRFQIADMQIAVDAARELAFGKDEPGQPTVKDVVRAVYTAYQRRNAGYPTMEHIVPVAAGGGDDDANLAIAHHGCNISWSTRGKDVAVEDRTQAFLTRRDERRQMRERRWDQKRTQTVVEFRAAEQKRRVDLVALWSEDDRLRREFRRLGDRLRVTTAEKERIKIQNRRGRIKVRREKIRRRVNRLEIGDLVLGGLGLVWP